MDKLSITLKIPTVVKAWLAAEGEPEYRTATEHAGYLCSQYLIQAHKRVLATTKNGTPPAHVED